MPALRIGALLAVALASLSAAGCATTTQTAAPGLAPQAAPATAAEAAPAAEQEVALALPETVDTLPSSYAGPTPSTALAALPPAPAAPAEPVLLASAEPAATSGTPTETVFVEGTPIERPAGKSRTELDTLIAKYAALYAVPETLVRAVVKRESNFTPTAYRSGNWGLMQIRHATARGMGYIGSASGLLDPETNLKYAVKYLRGAYLVAQGDARRADKLYQRGYYYDAKRMGLLDETGLGRDRRRRGI